MKFHEQNGFNVKFIHVILCSVYKHVIRTVDDEPGENFTNYILFDKMSRVL